MSIEVRSLTKTYRRRRVVNDVSFSCPPGGITGFLGPNGAGKSTTMRMIVGLTRPTSGGATVGGRPYASLKNPARTVGVLLDASALPSQVSGKDVCHAAADLIGVPNWQVTQMLERVGLSEAGNARVKDYSLGMRQRLGIAIALLGDPRVLILDEPVNGLDPAGVAWVRGLLKDFAAKGGTVLLSSHLLSEVQHTVDRVVVLVKGEVVADGSLEDLVPAPPTGVRALDLVPLERGLTEQGIEYHRERGELIIQAPTEVLARVIADHRVAVTHMAPRQETTLEAVYLRLTREEHDVPTVSPT